MINSISFDEFRDLICSGERSCAMLDMLRAALFYYCSGKDPTPIVGLYSEFPLFIYSDLVRYGRGELAAETDELKERLKTHGFACVRSEEIGFREGAILTEWEKDGVSFLLLYVKGDAWQTYKAIYGEHGEAIPRCISNYRYEMNARHFLGIERRAEYVLGHSYDKEHHAVRELKYYGDYSGNTVTLFEL